MWCLYNQYDKLYMQLWQKKAKITQGYLQKHEQKVDPEIIPL